MFFDEIPPSALLPLSLPPSLPPFYSLIYKVSSSGKACAASDVIWIVGHAASQLCAQAADLLHVDFVTLRRFRYLDLKSPKTRYENGIFFAAGLWWFFADFVVGTFATLRPFWCFFVLGSVGSLLGPLGSPWGSPWVSWGPPGGPLGSLCGLLGGPLGTLWGPQGRITSVLR